MTKDFNQLPADDQNIEWVKSKISHMYEVDQYFYKRYRNVPIEHGYTSEERQYFKKALEELHNEINVTNTNDIKSLLQIYPWFRISEFGEDIDEKAWLLVQHADDDPEFQKSILVVLENLVKINETNPTNFAYLFDRVAASWADPSKRILQRYGTQGACVGVNNWEPIPLEDPANLNVRRASVGLDSIEEYKSLMNGYCH